MKALRIIVTLFSLALLVWAAFALLAPDSEPTETRDSNGFFGAIFPSGSTARSPMTEITLTDGSSVQVPDLTTGKTPAELTNATYYELTEGDDSADGSFTVTYGTDSSFAIQLLEEPLSESRAAAEGYLRLKLGLSDAQMCALDTTVAVPNSVNEFYSGSDLGLSFCPGSVQLP
jgi:hypothetical protein